MTMDGAPLQTRTPGAPIVPTSVYNFQIPAHASAISVSCHFNEAKTLHLSQKIRPAPRYIFRSSGTLTTEKGREENEHIYGSSAFYPSSSFEYRITCGRNDDNIIVNFVDVEIYPVQYSPANNEVKYLSGQGEITITYSLMSLIHNPLNEECDLVIIAPESFSQILQKLVDHKNAIGTTTILKTAEDIYDEYEGRDRPEDIKLFIRDAYETWNITSVLLVGGLKSHLYADDREDANQGSTDWWIPVRYTNIYLYDAYSATASPYEPGCPSDLYYADLYKKTLIFDDWDTNNNSIFAEVKTDMYGYSQIDDTLDLRPDVYVSRLPCTTKREVKTIINKIITYEQTTVLEKPWFDTMMTIAGKTSRLYQGKPDGEYVCDKAIEYMGSLVTPVRLYATNNDTGGPRPIPEDIISEFKKGAGYVNFEGHGNPLRWDTIWADGSYPADWCGGLKVSDFIRLTNRDKLPVVIIGGCHNGLFNVTMLQSMRDLPRFLNRTRYWCHGVPAPVCFAWGLCILPYGGAIASVAGTGLGIGPGGGTPLEYSAALESNFFYAIGQKNASTFGEAYKGAINRYLNTHPTLDAMDYHCISIYQPFGDPSLKLGGG
ncbi:MAG: hypothetical protein JXA00_04245 [Candidatus Thermoplasmatota archaeon]|nr:hypothetical protein [Candidatus Thermoplasmatota archaeon]